MKRGMFFNRQHITAIGIFVVVMVLMGSHACRRNPPPPPGKHHQVSKPTKPPPPKRTSQSPEHPKSKNIKTCWIMQLLYSNVFVTIIIYTIMYHHGEYFF